MERALAAFLSRYWQKVFIPLSKSSKIDTYVSLAALMLMLLNLFFPDIIEAITPFLLILGLIFPGIPHGAADHWAALKQENMRLGFLIKFVLLYLLAMFLVLLLWLVHPLWGLCFFLAYSAWHFGETDMREWQAYTPFRASVWGIVLLAILLIGHWPETAIIIEAYGIDLPTGYQREIHVWGSLSSIALGLAIGFSLKGKARKSWTLVFIILVMGVFLPLLLAFGLYFIGSHSSKGWLHLKEKFNVGDGQLLIRTAPFSLGAFALAALAYWASGYYAVNGENLWPWLFTFIAIISAPHILIMHRLYGRKPISQSAVPRSV